jgi:AcrR family transcriptional regulator
MQNMVEKRTRRPRDPEGTREAILEAAGAMLAKDGPEGLSLSEVAHLAGVNRGTAYQHFATREKLVKAASEWVADKLFRNVFGEGVRAGERKIEEVDVAALNDRITEFAMENSELCQGWLMHVLSLPDPASDPFWREYEGSLERFASTKLAQPDIDTEVLAVIMLAATFVWPVWAQAHAKTNKERRQLAHRFSQEVLRLTMYGSLKPERYPEIAERLEQGRTASKKAKAAG